MKGQMRRNLQIWPKKEGGGGGVETICGMLRPN